MWKKMTAGFLGMALAAGGVPVLAAEASPAVSVIQEGAQQESDIRVAEAAQQSDTSQKSTQVQSKTVPSSVQTEQEGTKEAAALDSRRIMINLASRSLALYEGTKKIRLYPIGPGKPETPTPVGYFSILSKDVNPTWTDPEDTENAIPSGEDNPLGYRWMAIQGNYGIHGTNRPESIGHYVSNGCIRMNEKDVEALFDLVKIGTPVEITYNRVVVEKTPDDIVAFYIYPDGYCRQPLDVAEVTRWLSGFGIQNFISDEDIQKKIEASDGEPTYLGKVYNIAVEGKKLKNKAVIQDGITYLPAIDLADAAGVNLGWDAAAQVLTSTYGRAIGYDKKDVLYCNADDVATLYHLQGGLSAAEGFVYRRAAASDAQVTPEPSASEKTADESNAAPDASIATEAAEKGNTQATSTGKAAATKADEEKTA